jgi:hypothetical protein
VIRALLAFLTVVVLGATGFIIYNRLTTGEWRVDPDDYHVRLPKLFGPRQQPMRVIYLHRAGLTLTGGDDDSEKNVSSIVREAKKNQVVFPKYKGSDKSWKAVVACVADMFKRYDVVVTDKRPAERGYVLTVIGGTPSLVGHANAVSGLAPFNSEAIEDPIVLVFSRTLQENTRGICETAAMEIAHTYGLDHEFNCKDPMTYLPACGAKQFQDADVRCGEKKARDCADGKPTQNSHQRLLDHLGARRVAANP